MQEPFCLAFLLCSSSESLLIMTKQSPLHQQYQPRCYEAYEFDDLQEDFSQFLEEAKLHASEAKLRSSSVHPEESGSGRSGSAKEKRPKDKNSWNSSLISWLKAGRKSKLSGEPAGNSQSKVAAGKRRVQVHVSGSIYSCGNGPDVKHWRPTSGPLTSLFKSTNREDESSIPYMTLRQQNSPRAVHSYGPLYVVT